MPPLAEQPAENTNKPVQSNEEQVLAMDGSETSRRQTEQQQLQQRRDRRQAVAAADVGATPAASRRTFGKRFRDTLVCVFTCGRRRRDRQARKHKDSPAGNTRVALDSADTGGGGRSRHAPPPSAEDGSPAAMMEGSEESDEDEEPELPPWEMQPVQHLDVFGPHFASHRLVPASMSKDPNRTLSRFNMI